MATGCREAEMLQFIPLHPTPGDSPADQRVPERAGAEGGSLSASRAAGMLLMGGGRQPAFTRELLSRLCPRPGVRGDVWP